ncbi:MAG: Hsp20/alpha crystallin family protein [Victivallaceae bacterium]|nr:Hsp20/alpha crystallin family protein [Victivallaceae bacterium]
MIAWKNFASGLLLGAAAVLPVCAGDGSGFFGDDPFFRECRRFAEDGRFPGGVSRCGFRMRETDGELTVEMATPGVAKEKFDLSVQNGILSISIAPEEVPGKPETDGKNGEKPCRRFVQRVKLPSRADLDKIKATYKDGVLRIFVPKAPETTAPERKIVIE